MKKLMLMRSNIRMEMQIHHNNKLSKVDENQLKRGKQMQLLKNTGKSMRSMKRMANIGLDVNIVGLPMLVIPTRMATKMSSIMLKNARRIQPIRAKVLKSLAANSDITLKKMAHEMQIKCDKYWGSFEKLNMLMFLPAILDPFYKLRGLKVALQPMFPQDDIDDIIQMVKDVVYEVFDQYVKHYSPSRGRETESLTNSSVVDKDESELWMEQLKEEVTRGSDQEELSRSEFDLFLHERCETKEQNILDWWRLNCHRYPILSRMVRDVLAIPITTVPSESAFSTGGRHLTENRSCLKPQMVEAHVCTQDWLRMKACKDVKGDNLDENDEDSKDNSIDCNEGTFFA